MNLKSLLALSDRGDTTSVDPQATVWPLHRLADQVFGDLRFGLPALLQGGGMPRLDVVEKDGGIEVTAELPGLSREEVRIELADDTLVISGEKRQEKEETQGSRKITERSCGAFARTLDLPAGIKAEDIEASMDKGILTVRLPKNSIMTHAPKRIEIKAT